MQNVISERDRAVIAATAWLLSGTVRNMETTIETLLQATDRVLGAYGYTGKTSA